MSYIWTFSPSSEPYLQRCLAAALLQQNENKWIQKFGTKNSTTLNRTAVTDEKFETKVIEIAPSPEEQVKSEPVSYEEFFESIENEIRLDVIAIKCLENSDLILKMAQRMSANAVEKLFNQIFTSKNIEINFLTALFHTFLPAYIKQQYSWLCIDLLVKTDNKYPDLFLKLLKILLEDTEIPNIVLNNYVSTLSKENQTKLVESLTNIDLSSESFKHNIVTIYTAYKDCTKTNRIQNYIDKNLLQHRKICSSDRNYGRLFLTYLQAEKALEHTVNVKQLEECLEVHRSPFKRPCVMMLKEFVESE